MFLRWAIKLPFALFLIMGIALGAWYGYFTWGRSAQKPPAHSVRIAESFPARQFTVDVQINGETAKFIVDTGAITTCISEAFASKLHLVVLEEGYSQGVGGRVESKTVRIAEMRIGDIVVKNVEADILPVPVNLLGMTFLEQMGKIEIEGSIMTLRQ